MTLLDYDPTRTDHEDESADIIRNHDLALLYFANYAAKLDVAYGFDSEEEEGPFREALDEIIARPGRASSDTATHLYNRITSQADRARIVGLLGLTGKDPTSFEGVTHSMMYAYIKAYRIDHEMAERARKLAENQGDEPIVTKDGSIDPAQFMESKTSIQINRQFRLPDIFAASRVFRNEYYRTSAELGKIYEEQGLEYDEALTRRFYMTIAFMKTSEVPEGKARERFAQLRGQAVQAVLAQDFQTANTAIETIILEYPAAANEVTQEQVGLTDQDIVDLKHAHKTELEAGQDEIRRARIAREVAHRAVELSPENIEAENALYGQWLEDNRAQFEQQAYAVLDNTGEIAHYIRFGDLSLRSYAHNNVDGQKQGILVNELLSRSGDELVRGTTSILPAHSLKVLFDSGLIMHIGNIEDFQKEFTIKAPLKGVRPQHRSAMATYRGKVSNMLYTTGMSDSDITADAIFNYASAS